MIKTISTSVSVIFRTFHIQCYLKTVVSSFFMNRCYLQNSKKYFSRMLSVFLLGSVEQLTFNEVSETFYFASQFSFQIFIKFPTSIVTQDSWENCRWIARWWKKCTYICYVPIYGRSYRILTVVNKSLYWLHHTVLIVSVREKWIYKS